MTALLAVVLSTALVLPPTHNLPKAPWTRHRAMYPALSTQAPGLSVTQRKAAVHVRMVVSAAPTLNLQLADDTTIQVQMSQKDAELAIAKVNTLVSSFQAKAQAAAEGRRGERFAEMDFTADGVSLHLECNPNLFPDAFTAQVYVSVSDGVLQVTSQCLLTQLIDALKAHKATWA